MMVVSVYTVAGLLGAAVSLFAYTALQAGFLRGQGYYYAGLNAIGAGLVLYSLQEAFNMSLALMQVA